MEKGEVLIVLGALAFAVMSLTSSQNASELQSAIIGLQKANDDCTAFYTMPIYRNGSLTGLSWKDFRNVATEKENFSLSSTLEGRELEKIYSDDNRSWINFNGSKSSKVNTRGLRLDLQKRLGIDLAIECKKQRIEAQNSIEDYNPKLERNFFLLGLILTLLGLKLNSGSLELPKFSKIVRRYY